MFKKACFALLLIVLFLLSGCASEKKGFLEYQNQMFESAATLEVNSSRYSVDIIKTSDDEYKIKFTSPDNLKGVSIEKKGNELTYSVGSVHVPIKAGTNLTANALELFSLSKENLVSSELSLLNGVKAEIKKFETENGEVLLYLKDDTKLPIRIEADFGDNKIALSFSRFEITESVLETD